jgi:hypothetical protein
MKEVIVYLFLGVFGFYEEPLTDKHPETHVLVERCKMPTKPKFFTAESPFKVGDTVLINTPVLSEFYFGKVVNMQE